MHGAGIKMATTVDRDFPALLDVTRLLSRVGRGPHTGIDRVEYAYLRWCLNTSADLWGFARVAGGFVLLDRDGLTTFLRKINEEEPWGKRDLRARIGVKTPSARGAAEADSRRLAIARPHSLADVPGVVMSDGLRYLNVGHANIREETLTAASQVGLRSVVFLHDAIPLEFPQFQTKESVEKFQAKFKKVAQYADVVITNSNSSADSLKRHGIGATATLSAVHLGINAERSETRQPCLNRPYFVAVSTIEPRKNYDLLLTIWEELGDTAPILHVIGRRGWAKQDLFRRLDKLVQIGTVIEHAHMEDAQLWPLLSGAQALLFPSFAEGFGLPGLEAAALGTPVVCGDLAIHRELLGAYPVYVSTQDRYLWKQRIIELSEQNLDDLREKCETSRPDIPTWDAHFGCVNQVIMDAQ